MKKQLAVLCVLIMTISNNGTYALEKAQEVSSSSSYEELQDLSEVDAEKLEGIILDAKARVKIDDKDAEFYYEISYERAMNTYLLNWNSKRYTTYLKYGEDKNIYEYFKYDNQIKPEESIKQLPVYSQGESEKVALEFLKAALPKEYKNYKIRKDLGSLNQNIYYIYFDYYKDGVIFEGINGSISVDGVTGEVISYFTNYSSDIKFESKTGVISQLEAEKAYKKNLGIKPMYLSEYGESGEIQGLKVVYVPKYDTSYVIDGKTGERISIAQRYFFGESENLEGDSSTTTDKTPALTEEELKEIEKKQELKSMAQAVDKSKGLGISGLGSDAKLENGYLYESYNNTEEGYAWGLYFTTASGEIYVQLDAKSLELISFGNYDYDYVENTISKEQIEAGKGVALKGVEKYSDISLSNLKLDEDYLQSQKDLTGPMIYYSFIRVENGIEFPENGIWIAYNINSKEISSYSKNWYTTLEFPNPKLADPEIIYKQMFEENKLELKYKSIFDEGILTSGKLVYEIDQLNYKLPLIFDGETGERMLQEEANPIPVAYKDIDKSKYKKELEILLQLGIGFSGGELKPNQAIKQNELLYLIAQTFDYSPRPLDKISSLTTEEVMYLEEILRQRGVLLENEKLTTTELKKEEAIKYLVRALGYEEIAKKPEIFVSTLRDFDKASKGLKGYVAIGDALQIIEKNSVGQFAPSSKLPRDEALKMIYNYLK